jgi:hypothetical protein
MTYDVESILRKSRAASLFFYAGHKLAVHCCNVRRVPWLSVAQQHLEHHERVDVVLKLASGFALREVCLGVGSSPKPLDHREI